MLEKSGQPHEYLSQITLRSLFCVILGPVPRISFPNKRRQMLGTSQDKPEHDESGVGGPGQQSAPACRLFRPEAVYRGSDRSPFQTRYP
ncbi:UNVERIFIED_ORG: hypothetical protein GGE53_004952 [Rhizobium etli]